MIRINADRKTVNTKHCFIVIPLFNIGSSTRLLFICDGRLRLEFFLSQLRYCAQLHQCYDAADEK